MEDSGAQAIAAWWGAILATIVFVWEIYKWLRSGPRLVINVAPNMQLALQAGVEDRLHIAITVSNVGDATTTITHLFGCAYKNRLASLRNKRCKTLIYSPSLTVNYPTTLEPGKTWTAWIPQAEALDSLKPSRYIKIGVLHSMSKRPAFSSIVNAG